MGAGYIGQVHARHVAREAILAAIIDPDPKAKAVADKYAVPCYASLAEMFLKDRPDGVIVATPNQLHVEHGLECIAAGVPVLVEKPLADDLGQAARLVNAAENTGVPLLVGHHRRYNPLIDSSKSAIDEGRLGKLVVVNAMCWLYKPDNYFDVPWRCKAGAGPVLTNMIHDLDLMRYLCGEIESVQAFAASEAREHAVEDTAVVIVRFCNGALGTLSVTDSVVAPWNWELTAGENADYPCNDSSSYTIGGTAGSLSLPDLGFWHYGTTKSWFEPLLHDTLPTGHGDPLALQINHFSDVALGHAAPLVSGREGLQTLRVLTAVTQAAASGDVVKVEEY
jgi:predicted dehydrogenase